MPGSGVLCREDAKHRHSVRVTPQQDPKSHSLGVLGKANLCRKPTRCSRQEGPPLKNSGGTATSSSTGVFCGGKIGRAVKTVRAEALALEPREMRINCVRTFQNENNKNSPFAKQKMCGDWSRAGARPLTKRDTVTGEEKKRFLSGQKPETG